MSSLYIDNAVNEASAAVAHISVNLKLFFLPEHLPVTKNTSMQAKHLFVEHLHFYITHTSTLEAKTAPANVKKFSTLRDWLGPFFRG